jgi:hypothetical protein
MSSGYHVTFDIDWAPDWSVRQTLEIVEQAGVSATYFVTHDSPTIAEIRAAGHELGIHPNFQHGSTQGSDPVAIVGKLLELVPEARTLRTHGLIQGSLLLRDVLRAFPQIAYDMTLLTYRFEHSGWFNWRLGGADVRRINYVWEDDFAFEDEAQDWQRYEAISSVDVLDFHPIHVSLNSRTNERYEQVKRELAGRPLTELQESDTEHLRLVAPGTADYLRAVLSSGANALTFEELLCV